MMGIFIEKNKIPIADLSPIFKPIYLYTTYNRLVTAESIDNGLPILLNPIQNLPLSTVINYCPPHLVIKTFIIYPKDSVDDTLFNHMTRLGFTCEKIKEKPQIESHFTAYREILKDQSRWQYLILENHSRPLSEYLVKFGFIRNPLKDIDHIQLSNAYKQFPLKHHSRASPFFYEIQQGFYDVTSAYMLTKNAAGRLVANNPVPVGTMSNILSDSLRYNRTVIPITYFFTEISSDSNPETSRFLKAALDKKIHIPVDDHNSKSFANPIVIGNILNDQKDIIIGIN